MQAYKFNPFTGKLDVVNKIFFKKKYITVDASFLTTRTITLDGTPITDSERLFVNGLLLDDNCYTIVGANVILDAGLNIAVNDFIDVRYVQ
jgi:hypothetical protein